MKFSSVAHGMCAVIALFVVGTAAAEERGDRILALGDSVVFGYITADGHAYVNADNFVGYPEKLAGGRRLEVVNASCPGEATTSFLSATGADNGCRSFRSSGAPLHTAYTSTQLAFATDFLQKHREVRLVTIGLGANDAFLLEASCATASRTSFALPMINGTR